MGRRLYVGNLPYSTGEAELQELFSRAGTVESVRVMRDPATGLAELLDLFGQLYERDVDPAAAHGADAAPLEGAKEPVA